MERRPSRRVGEYRVTVIETFGHDLERAEAGLELWRRFVRSAPGQRVRVGDLSRGECELVPKEMIGRITVE